MRSNLEISLETIIRRVVLEVIRELKNQGIRTVTVEHLMEQATSANTDKDRCIRLKDTDPGTRVERPDMTGYKTPVLTERHILKLHALTESVVMPKGTVVSPKAKELLRDKNILLRME